ncbi:MAG TPA: class I tRNA ligase family protein [Dissulfurispiraceae bacterium]|nr:class I tRNA ligase family protein [Dissulfurispiraceae bacterium]
MLKLYNTFGRKMEAFKPVDKNIVSVFTCGPSVYQRAHIGNMRTFLFEDIVVRYLEYSGYKVRRGMNITDIEDKALREAEKEGVSLKKLTDVNVKKFIGEIRLLRMKVPDYLPKASEHIDQAVDIIGKLLESGSAYWYQGNVYFDPLKFKGFGKLFGLDMSRWPKKKKRFHKDTYPGIQWNLGDFILWHGYEEGDDVYWDTKIGKGRPSWNIQDPSMIVDYFNDTLSIYCGGIDNLYRHHDYTLAILESIRPFPMARCWMHCQHLFVNGQKMSKSKGNILYVDTLMSRGYSAAEVRFFLTHAHYRERLNYSDRRMEEAASKLKEFRRMVAAISRRAGKIAAVESKISSALKKVFAGRIDNDLDVGGAFDGLHDFLSGLDVDGVAAAEASGIIRALKEIDQVLQVVF